MVYRLPICKARSAPMPATRALEICSLLLENSINVLCRLAYICTIDEGDRIQRAQDGKKPPIYFPYQSLLLNLIVNWVSAIAVDCRKTMSFLVECVCFVVIVATHNGWSRMLEFIFSKLDTCSTCLDQGLPVEATSLSYMISLRQATEACFLRWVPRLASKQYRQLTRSPACPKQNLACVNA